MLAILTLLSACTGTADIDSGKDTTDSAADSDTSPANPNAPVVLSVETSCSPNTDGEDTWFVNAAVTDAQGDDTFSRGNLYIYLKDPAEGAGATADQPMVCTTGSCLTSWEDIDGKAGCDISGRFWMRILVTDDDGNLSEPYDFQPSA